MTAEVHRVPPHAMSEELVLSKLRYLIDVQLWPITSQLDPISWLNNFTQAERPYAVHVLNVFLYLSERIIDAIFLSTVQSLSSPITAGATSLGDAQSRWRRFLCTARITYVQGENPSPADSGHLFVRRARQLLNIPENRIVDPDTALEHVARNPTTPVLFVDDFVGSGRQMECTWKRRRTIGFVQRVSSFDEIVGNEHQVIYVPLVATDIGIKYLSLQCPNLKINPGYRLDKRYSLVSDESILWPPDLKNGAGEVLHTASMRAGVGEAGSVGWKGYNDLALPIAFSHGVPDSTLPLIWWESRGWVPLVRRS